MLELDNDIFSWDDLFDREDFFFSDAGVEAEGYYSFSERVDLGDVYVSRISAQMAAIGIDFGEDVFNRTDFFTVDDFFGGDSSLWRATIEMRTTNDDPAGSPTWSTWETLAPGDYSARAFEFRLKLESLCWGVTPAVSYLLVTVDMPDRVISGSDIVVPAAGLTIAFDPPFYGFGGVGIAAQGLQTGDYYELTDKDEDGFHIIFKNAANVGVERTTDYVAKGYGRRIA
jgi:hypothetical protein